MLAGEAVPGPHRIEQGKYPRRAYLGVGAERHMMDEGKVPR